MQKLIQFETLEDALLELNTRITPKNGYQNPDKVVRDINPARYDFGPVDKFTRQIKKQIGLTFCQQNFAIKLITKYAKQWKKCGYDVSNIDKNTPTLYKMREVDRQRLIDIDTGKELITMKFLYHPRIIATLYTFREIRSAGKVEFNKDSRLWELAITPENLEFVQTFGQASNTSSTCFLLKSPV